jgi:hypothetical protein
MPLTDSVSTSIEHALENSLISWILNAVKNSRFTEVYSFKIFKCTNPY